MPLSSKFLTESIGKKNLKLIDVQRRYGQSAIAYFLKPLYTRSNTVCSLIVNGFCSWENYIFTIIFSVGPIDITVLSTLLQLYNEEKNAHQLKQNFIFFCHGVLCTRFH